MVKRIAVFQGRQTTDQVKAFFDKTKAETINMQTQEIEGQYYFMVLVEVDLKRYRRYIEKMGLD